MSTSSQRPAQVPKELPRTGSDALRTFLRHTSPRVLIALCAVLVPARLALGEWSLMDVWIALAILAYWPFNEWLIHVFVLHHRPRRILGLRWDYLVAHRHRQHHADPWHLPLVFIPVHVFPASIAALLLLAWLLAPSMPLALTGLSVYLLLSLHYEWCHYLAHIGWCPQGFFGHYQRRVREHRLHHFRNEQYWWGVSMGAADRVLRTAPAADAVSRSDGTADLGLKTSDRS